MSIEIDSYEYRRDSAEVHDGVQFQPEPELVTGCEESDAKVDEETDVDGSLTVQ